MGAECIHRTRNEPVMVNAKATVIIPCYNVEDYIHDCLDSVLLQGKAVAETFVIDNNCTDETMRVVSKWQSQHPEFRLSIRREKKKGAPAARNHALTEVRTEWVQFLDADDILCADKISEQVLAFPEADVICGGAVHLSLGGKQKRKIPNPNIALGLIEGNMGNTCSNLFRTSMLREIQGWDESLTSSQEYDLMFRIWKMGGQFQTEDTIRSVIRQRPSGQISQSNAKIRWNLLVSKQMEMLEFMETKKMDDGELHNAMQAVFDKLRILFQHDFVIAQKQYSILREKNFKPQMSTSCSRYYIVLCRIIGVPWTEKLLSILRH